jgi:hypothetical protein
LAATSATAEHLPTVEVGHHQVEDDQVVAGLQGAGHGVGAVAGEIGGIPGGGEGATDERSDLGFVVDDKDAPQV